MTRYFAIVVSSEVAENKVVKLMNNKCCPMFATFLNEKLIILIIYFISILSKQSFISFVLFHLQLFWRLSVNNWNIKTFKMYEIYAKRCIHILPEKYQKKKKNCRIVWFLSHKFEEIFKWMLISAVTIAVGVIVQI